jgi:hypothetical protein
VKKNLGLPKMAASEALEVRMQDFYFVYVVNDVGEDIAILMPVRLLRELYNPE